MLRELLALFEIGVDDKQLKSAHEAVNGFKHTLGTVATAVAGAFAIHEVTSFIGEQIRLGATLDDEAQRLGVATEELEKWQYAAKLSGIEAEGANHGLMHLNKSLGEALGGNADAAQTFAALGVHIKDTQGKARELSDVVPDLADAFSKLHSPQEQTATAMKIFGKQGAALIPLLKGGKEGVGKLYAEFRELGGGLAKGFIPEAAKADDELDRMHFAFRGLTSQFVVAVLPQVTRFISILTRGVVWLRNLDKQTNVVQTTLWALAAVSAVLAGIWLALNIEIVLVVAALALLYLAFDDIYTLFTGGDSVIGRFIDQLYGVGASKKFVEDVKNAVNGVVDTFTELYGVATEAGGVLSDIWIVARPLAEWFFKLVIDSQLEMLGGAKSFYTFMIGMWGDIAQVAGQALQQIDDLAPAWLKLLLGDKLGGVKSFGAKLEHMGARASEVVAPPSISGGDSAVLMPTRGDRSMGGPNIGTQNQSNQVTVNVQGGQTNGETGGVVARAVREAMKGFQNQLNSANAAITGGG